MDHTPSSSSSSASHHHLEWMRRISSSSSNSNYNTNNNNPSSRIEILDEEDDGGGDEAKKAVFIEREHMFDKVVTPSDVGKLNRLVIPKQHAEKYFPLDSSNNEKGLLLNFEDRTGKPWRFRYSYWNSSQSYVMTKGWSRFVKEKKLDAGDIVSFQRGVGEGAKDKLFIDWRRRPEPSGLLTFPSSSSLGGGQFYHHHHPRDITVPGVGWGTGSSPSPPFVLRSHPYPLGLQEGRPSGVWDQQGLLPYPARPHHMSSMSLLNVQSHHLQPRRGPGLGGGPTSSGGGGYGYGFGNVVNPYPVIVLRPASTSAASSSTQNGGGFLFPSQEDPTQRVPPLMMVKEGGNGEEGIVFESVPVVQGKVAAKRLRLFGVNMDCPISNQTHDFDILSSSLASSSSTFNHQQQNEVAISMGLTSNEKGKSSNITSSPMSLDLDI